MGRASVDSQIKKNSSPIAAMMESVTMSGELNQSASFPLSSTICRAPTPMTSAARPTTSTLARSVTSGRPRIWLATRLQANMPTGPIATNSCP